MTFDELFIRTKMKALKGYIKEIKGFLEYSDAEIFEDSGRIHIGERVFQLAVDAVIDINQHIMKELELKGAEDPQGAFYILGEKKILPKKFAFKIAPIVAVRNRIVHGYESLDQSLFTKNLRANYSDFEKYINHIGKFLESGKMKK